MVGGVWTCSAAERKGNLSLSHTRTYISVLKGTENLTWMNSPRGKTEIVTEELTRKQTVA